MRVLHVALVGGQVVEFHQPGTQITQKHNRMIVHDGTKPIGDFKSNEVKAWWFREEEEEGGKEE